MDIGNSKLKCLPARGDSLLQSKQKFNNKHTFTFFKNYFALLWIHGYFLYIWLFGCFVIWLWVSLIDKNFQFCHCIFLFIFSFYLVVAPTILWRSTLCWCAHFTQCQTKIKLSSCPAWNKKVWKKGKKHRPHIYLSSCRTQSIMNRKW